MSSADLDESHLHFWVTWVKIFCLAILKFNCINKKICELGEGEEDAISEGGRIDIKGMVGKAPS